MTATIGYLLLFCNVTIRTPETGAHMHTITMIIFGFFYSFTKLNLEFSQLCLLTSVVYVPYSVHMCLRPSSFHSCSVQKVFFFSCHYLRVLKNHPSTRFSLTISFVAEDQAEPDQGSFFLLFVKLCYWVTNRKLAGPTVSSWQEFQGIHWIISSVGLNSKANGISRLL